MIYTKQEKQKLEQVISVFAERLKESDAFDLVWSDNRCQIWSLYL